MTMDWRDEDTMQFGDDSDCSDDEPKRSKWETIKDINHGRSVEDCILDECASAEHRAEAALAMERGVLTYLTYVVNG